MLSVGPAKIALVDASRRNSLDFEAYESMESLLRTYLSESAFDHLAFGSKTHVEKLEALHALLGRTIEACKNDPEFGTY
jgi:hypothetical protein